MRAKSVWEFSGTCVLCTMSVCNCASSYFYTPQNTTIHPHFLPLLVDVQLWLNCTGYKVEWAWLTITTWSSCWQTDMSVRSLFGPARADWIVRVFQVRKPPTAVSTRYNLDAWVIREIQSQVQFGAVLVSTPKTVSEVQSLSLLIIWYENCSSVLICSDDYINIPTRKQQIFSRELKWWPVILHHSQKQGKGKCQYPSSVPSLPQHVTTS